MADAKDVDRQLDIAQLAVLTARVCWGEWVAPPPEYECTLTDEEYAKRRKVELAAANAEHALWEAQRILREGFLGGYAEAGPAEAGPAEAGPAEAGPAEPDDLGGPEGEHANG